MKNFAIGLLSAAAVATTILLVRQQKEDTKLPRLIPAGETQTPISLERIMPMTNISMQERTSVSDAFLPSRSFGVVKAVGGTTTHWAGASLRFQEHEWKARTTYGDVEGATLLDWPIDAAEMDPYYEKAENKLGVTRTGGREGLPGNNNYKIFEKGAKAHGVKYAYYDRDQQRVSSLRRSTLHDFQ